MLSIDFLLLDGRTCILREARADDAQAFLDFLPATFLETDFLRYLPGEFSFTLEEETLFIKTRADDPKATLLLVECGGEVVACAGAERSSFRRFAHQVEIGMIVAQAYWGLGIGRKLLSTLSTWAEQMGLRKITLSVFAENHRALSLYESFGFEREGLLKEDHLRTDGRYGDTLVMGKFLAGA